MKKNRIGFALVALFLAACNVDAPVVAAPSLSVKAAGAPDIVMSGSSIAFSGNKVRLGESLSSWKKAVPGTPRCTDGKSPPIICTWDQLGLEVGSDDAQTNVQFVSLFLRVPAVDTEPAPNNPDGTPAAVSTAALPPKLPFSGRLQLDGMDITARTAFAQVRSGIDKSRNVRCGSLDCSGPHGKFGAGAKIFFELDGRSDTDAIARIGLAMVDGYK
jgi:hypothetical protein